MITRWPSPLFIVIIALYLLSGCLYATMTPPWQNPDEPAHYNYIRYVATHAHFPELVGACYDQNYLSQLTSRRFPPELSIDTVCYEYHQPPLYYALLAPLFLLTHGSLLALRFMSILFGLGTVITAYTISRALYPDQAALAYGTMAFTAFVPMHTAMVASVNNDSLAGLLLALMLLMVAHDRSLEKGKMMGLLLGLILLTKLTVYLAIVLVGLTIILTNPSWARRWQQGVWVYGLALLIAAPWYLRNLWLYGQGDIVGLKRHDAVVVGQLRTFDHIATIGWPTYFHDLIQTTFHSFWGQFGWMAVPMDGRVYTLLTLFCVVALSGLLDGFRPTMFFKPCRSRLKKHGRSTWLIGLTICLTFAAFSWYNWQFVQFQGRYLFPAIIPIGLLFNMGLIQAFQPTWSGRLVLVLGITGSLLIAMSPDKWTLLLTALPFGLAIGRARYPQLIPTDGLMIGCYIALAALTLATPAWFIAPNLSP